jgi:hypothetical protein
VDAIRYDGENVDQVKAACRLANVALQLPNDPTLNHLATSIAIWSADGIWHYLGVGDWLLRFDEGLRVVGDDLFRVRYVRRADAARIKPTMKEMP